MGHSKRGEVKQYSSDGLRIHSGLSNHWTLCFMGSLFNHFHINTVQINNDSRDRDIGEKKPNSNYSRGAGSKQGQAPQRFAIGRGAVYLPWDLWHRWSSRKRR